jgi:hypothetical protein
MRAGAVPPGRRRRTGPSPCCPAPDQRPPAGVNHDASLFLSAAPASGPSAPHAPAGHGWSAGSAGPPAAASRALPAWRSPPGSRPARGHSSCRRQPARGSWHTETGDLIPRLPLPCRRSAVDERLGRQDTGPAFVPGTMWGTAPISNLPGCGRRRACPQLWQAISPPPRANPAPTLPQGGSRPSRAACRAPSLVGAPPLPPPARGRRPYPETARGAGYTRVRDTADTPYCCHSRPQHALGEVPIAAGCN